MTNTNIERTHRSGRTIQRAFNTPAKARAWLDDKNYKPTIDDDPYAAGWDAGYEAAVREREQ